MRHSIKIKVLAAQVGLIIVMVFFLRGVGYRVVSRLLFDMQQEQLMVLLQTGMELFEYRMSDYRKHFEELATHEIVTVYAKKYKDPMLREYWAAFQDKFPVLSFVNAEGMEEFKLVDGDSGQLANISTTPLFQNAMRTPGNVVMSSVILDENRGPTIRFAMNSVTFFDEFIAVITGDVPLANATGVLANHTIGETGVAMLVDHHGTILFHPQQEYISQSLIGHGNETEELLSGLALTETGFSRATLLGIDGYAAYAPLRENPWSVVVFLPYKEFMAELNFINMFIPAITAAFVLIASLIAFKLANRITNPLIQLATVTQKIAKGDLSTKVAVRAQDEIGMLATSFNAMIDDVKSNKEDLIHAREHLEVTLSSIGDGVLATDAAGVVTFINPIAEQLVGLTAQEALGKPVTDIFQLVEEGSRESVVIPVERVSGENTVVGITDPVILLAHDGREIPIEASGAPIQGQDKKVRGVVLILHDMTDWRQAEARRKTLEEQLHQAQKMEAVGTLAGGIAHDLNSMLGVIVGYGYMLEKPTAEGSKEDFVQEILTATRRAKDLILRLNTFSRPTVERKQPLHLHELIRESIELLQPVLPPAIELSVITENPETLIEGDASRLQQVITNLCFNARDAISEGNGRITLLSEDVEVSEDLALLHQVQPGKYLRLRVQDTGDGIAAQDLDKIFDPFFTTKEIGKGTGLGLSVVYGIVKSHQGFVTVESRPGEGTTFELYFPVMENTT
jgi:PAS domain S-box-containing protein